VCASGAASLCRHRSSPAHTLLPPLALCTAHVQCALCNVPRPSQLMPLTVTCSCAMCNVQSADATDGPVNCVRVRLCAGLLRGVLHVGDAGGHGIGRHRRFPYPKVTNPKAHAAEPHHLSSRTSPPLVPRPFLALTQPCVTPDRTALWQVHAGEPRTAPPLTSCTHHSHCKQYELSLFHKLPATRVPSCR
jgi:hypothetical protein